MIDANALLGEPLLFQGRLKIYPPIVRDVVTNVNFNLFCKVLTLTQEDIKYEIKGKIQDGEVLPTPFEYLLLSAQYINGFSALLKDAFFFFCKVKVRFLFDENKIVFENTETDNQKDLFFVCNENFFDFQNCIRRSMGDAEIKPEEPINPNEDPRVRKIKEQAKERDRLKAKQNKKNGISLSTCLVAICCMEIGITPLNIGEMSYASVGALMKMMQDKEKYVIDIKSLLAGADSKKVKPKYWIRNNDEE